MYACAVDDFVLQYLAHVSTAKGKGVKRRTSGMSREPTTLFRKLTLLLYLKVNI